MTKDIEKKEPIEAEFVERTPELIAKEINSIKTQTLGILTAAVLQGNRSCFEIGKRLCEVKELIGHGNWGEWLESNVSYSESTAQNLMKIYREYGNEQIDMLTGHSKLEIFEKLNYSQMVAMFSLPEPERTEFVETHDMNSLSSREIQKLIREKQEAEQHAKDVERMIEEINQNVDKRTQEAVDKARKEAEQKAKKEAEAEMLEVLRKEREKDTARQNPSALEINLLFTQLQVNIQQISDKLKLLKAESKEVGEQTALKIKKGIDSILVAYLGFGVS